MKAARLFPAVAMIAAIAPLGAAHADPPCANNFAVYSGGSGHIDPSVLICQANGPDPDPRVIIPGTTAIGAAYLLDIGEDVPFVMGTFDGLGFTNKSVKFTRTVRTTGNVTYDTPNTAIPGGRTASGCVTVSITFGTGEDAYTESSSYHTVDASCPLE